MEGSVVTWYFMWLPVTCFLTMCLSSVSHGTALSYVKGVAIDLGFAPEPMKARSVYAPFANRNQMWAQLWVEVKIPNQVLPEPQYRLVWQALIRPQRGNGSLEYINLPSDNYPQILKDMWVGVTNVDLPGPLNAVHADTADFILSVNGSVANLSDTLKFDRIFFPYHIPLSFCEDLDCPRVFRVQREPVAIGLLGEGRSLMTEEMIVGLIVWNIVLSIILIIVLLVLICLCAGLERRKKYKSRKYRNGESEVEGGPRSSPGWGPTDSWRTEQRMSPDTTSDKQQLAQADELSRTRTPSERSGIDSPISDDDQPMESSPNITYYFPRSWYDALY